MRPFRPAASPRDTAADTSLGRSPGPGPDLYTGALMHREASSSNRQQVSQVKQSTIADFSPRPRILPQPLRVHSSNATPSTSL
ncbi:zinc finger protein GLIS3-like [Heterocephalus glaber]|uniref:Zinc finger protein GLIS3-like n=1 Tax=Heterocephalus glaber TaxID=10181 RepID=A0AAX6NW84_HETGA|nr:zinc finger protein GLIS3-like [Heterocephalus glaber]